MVILLDTKLKTFGRSKGIKLLGAQLGHSRGKTSWGTAGASSNSGHISGTNKGKSIWGAVEAYLGHTFLLDIVGAGLS